MLKELGLNILLSSFFTKVGRLLLDVVIEYLRSSSVVVAATVLVTTGSSLELSESDGIERRELG